MSTTSVENSVTMSFPRYRWDFRLVEFEDANAADEEASYIKMCVVYYDNDTPYEWSDIEIPHIDSLELRGLHGGTLILKRYLNYVEKITAALQKPILMESIFPSKE